ncbi:TPA: hypothetical protein F8R87_08800 [Legionella pneumophila]|nr:hypothetical protein [Legionella pneumophila]
MPKKKQLQPKRKRMKSAARLRSAKSWIPTYTGSNIIKGYRKWFGVDLPCAIRELRCLGVKLDEHYINAALQSREQLIVLNQKKREEKAKKLKEPLFDSDDNFYFIAGYTSWGFPYGITWDEAELDNLIEVGI